MSMVVRSLAALLALGVAGRGVAAGGEATSNAVGRQEAVRILHVVIASTNRVTLGSNTMSLVAATNVIAMHRESLDAIAIHGSIEAIAPVTLTSSAVAGIARVGVPLLFVEEDGERPWREQSGATGVRTVRIGTDQLAALRHFWRRGRDGANPSHGPVLRSSVDWDAAAGTYELKRIELGLFGESVWLMREQPEADEKSGSIGIQLKREW